MLATLFRRKDLDRVIREAGDPNRADGHAIDSGGLKRHLGAYHLVALGVGAIIGAGIFSLTGTAAAEYAGPGIVYSFVLAGTLCAFAGFCYAELASMIPVAGSAYAYSYTTMGEIIAWIIGWDLILEYTFGAVTVSIAWSGYLYSLLHNSLGIDLPVELLRLTKGPFETVELPNGATAPGIVNLPAVLIGLVLAAVLYRGIRESAWVNNLIVVVKVSIVLAFIALGIGVIQMDNLIADPTVTGPAALVPPARLVEGVSHYGWGLGGVLTGAGVVFFAYIGFDAVSTTAQETKNPAKDLPIGILGSLVVCTILYVLVAVVLSGVVPYRELGVSDPIAVGIDRIVELRQWPATARSAFTFSVKLGALAGLTSVILVLLMAQARVFYAMSRDGLLPWFKDTHPKFHTPHRATIVTGVFVATCASVMPISLVGELVSIGTLLAFVLVCLGVPILRYTNPDTPRPFRVKAPWVVGGLGAATCLLLMIGLPWDTWLRMIIWLIIGFVIYFGYGRTHSALAREAAQKKTDGG
ncbi:MAG: amino acid permease [Sandaracinaceae bacterium]|nr:amino acid permease [Sandaracinaceae bacterium]